MHLEEFDDRCVHAVEDIDPSALDKKIRMLGLPPRPGIFLKDGKLAATEGRVVRHVLIRSVLKAQDKPAAARPLCCWDCETTVEVDDYREE
jgi:hypothetical protein